MTAEKEPQTEAERKEAARLENERIEKELAEIPGMILPTREMGKVVIDRVEIRGEPLSRTVIKERREARY